jgi:Tetratricopeptide repeat
VRSREIRERQLGADHPDAALSNWNLGGLYQKQERYLDAEARYRKALAIAEAKLGLDHSDTQGIRNSLDSLL